MSECRNHVYIFCSRCESRWPLCRLPNDFSWESHCGKPKNGVCYPCLEPMRAEMQEARKYPGMHPAVFVERFLQAVYTWRRIQIRREEQVQTFERMNRSPRAFDPLNFLEDL